MKKNYVVAVKDPADSKLVHELLSQDGTIEKNIPTNACECTDIKCYSSRRSTYLLDEDEVTLLLNNDKISSIKIDGNFHFEERESLPPPAKIKQYATRYTTSTKHYRNAQAVPSTATTAELDRTGYQIARLEQNTDPWSGTYTTPAFNFEGFGNYSKFKNDFRSNAALTQQVTYTNDGSDVDVVISDDACWAAHPEFVENGVSQVLDLVLDGPYYLDPNAFTGGELTTYLGRTTCTEAAAKAWWSTPSNRSPQFQPFSSILIGSNYTRANMFGTNSSYANYGNHGTACASQAYGKNFGWAFNANKWFIHYGIEPNTLTLENHWDIIKIFHDYKQNNSSYGNKNPLVVSTSWGYVASISLSGTNYINYRGETTAYTSETIPEAIYNINTYPAWQILDPDNAAIEYACQIDATTETAAADDLAETDGVFIFNAAGNSNQIITYEGTDDYNNYWNTSQSTTTSVIRYFNRIGHPGNVGPNNNSPNKYLTFSIGALHDAVADDNGVKKEQRVDYSNTGIGIDLYTPANRSLGANNNQDISPDEYPNLNRYDPPGEIGYLGIQAFDTIFSGTSSACPVAAGFYACFLQTRRNWNALKLKKYIYTTLPVQSSDNFYYGLASTEVNDPNFSDYSSLQGGVARVPYLLEAPSITINQQPPTTQDVTLGNAVALTVFASETLITGTLSYQWEKADAGSPTIFTSIPGATSNTYGFAPSLSDDGDVYRCRINGTFGVDETITNTTTLSVIQEAAGSQRFYVYQTFGLNNDGLDTFCAGVYAKRIRAGDGNNAANYTYTNSGASSVVVRLDDVNDLTTGMYAHLFPTIAYGTRADGTVDELFSQVTITNISGNDITLTHGGGASVLGADLNYLPDVITRITFSPTDVNKEVCFRPTDTSPPFSASPIGLTTNFDVAMVDDFTSNGGGNLNPNGKVTYSALEVKHALGDVTSNVLVYNNQTISGYLPIEDDAGNTFYMILGD